MDLKKTEKTESIEKPNKRQKNHTIYGQKAEIMN